MTSPMCRLFLVVPDGAGPETAAACLEAAVAAGDVAALQVRQGPSEEAMVSMVTALKPIAQKRDIALLIAGDAEVARRLGADGVEVANLAGYGRARKLLGPSAIVGADCGTSRHAGMELGEAGADYVGFRDPAGAGRDLIAWWAELFEVPCVALDPADAAAAGELARHGADFVRPTDAMWASPAMARDIVGATMAAISEASA